MVLDCIPLHIMACYLMLLHDVALLALARELRRAILSLLIIFSIIIIIIFSAMIIIIIVKAITSSPPHRFLHHYHHDHFIRHGHHHMITWCETCWCSWIRGWTSGSPLPPASSSCGTHRAVLLRSDHNDHCDDGGGVGGYGNDIGGNDDGDDDDGDEDLRLR